MHFTEIPYDIFDFTTQVSHPSFPLKLCYAKPDKFCIKEENGTVVTTFTSASLSAFIDTTTDGIVGFDWLVFKSAFTRDVFVFHHELRVILGSSTMLLLTEDDELQVCQVINDPMFPKGDEIVASCCFSLPDEPPFSHMLLTIDLHKVAEDPPRGISPVNFLHYIWQEFQKARSNNDALLLLGNRHVIKTVYGNFTVKPLLEGDFVFDILEEPQH